MAKKKVVFKDKTPKDDGSRWSIFNKAGRQIYLGDGLKKEDADRIVNSLVEPATLQQVVPPTEG